MKPSIAHSFPAVRFLLTVRAALLFVALLLKLSGAFAQTVTTSAEQHWSTYLGGIGEDQVLSIATDAFGHVYVAGRTSEGLPLGNDTTGQSGLTHQGTYGGGASDAFLAKIAPQGSVLWCTYFGGEGDDEAVALVVTGMNGLYLVGNTSSAQGIATDTLAHQQALGGGRDMFIARFTEYGALESATYFGGPDDEIASTSVLDIYGHLIIGGSTSSADCLGNTQSAQTYSGGIDGLLLHFSGTGTMIAGTFVGGEGDDHVVRLETGDSTGVVLVGNTNSTQNMTTTSALTSTLQGGTDAFVMRMDTNLVMMRGTYIGGAADDLVHGLVQGDAFIALCGISYSDTLYTDTTSLQSTNAGGGDGFIVVLNDQLELAWCSFFGDTAYDVLTAVDMDLAGRLYAAGTTASENGVSTGFCDGSILLGATDVLIMRFNEPNMLAWTRYVGAMGEEEARALRVKGNTSIFLGGSTTSTEDLAVLGHQTGYGGGSNDGAAFRLDQLESTICEGICTGTNSSTGGSGTYNGVTPPLNELHVCLGGSVTLIVFGGALGAYSEWMWYADECGVPEHYMTMGDTITFTPTASFTLYVRAESLTQTTDCRSIQIVVHSYPEPLIVVSDTVCPGMTIQLQGSNAEWFSWAMGDTLVNGNQAELTAPMQAGTAYVEVTATNGPSCSVVSTMPVEVLPAPAPIWEVTNVTCYGGTDGTITTQGASDTLYTIVWAHTGSSEIPLEGLDAGVYVVTTTDNRGCIHTDSLTVSMPVALMDSVSVTPALCSAATGAALVHSISTSAGLAYSIDDEELAGLMISDLLPGTYLVTASDSSGCLEQLDVVIIDIGSISVSAGDTVIATNGVGLLQAFVIPNDTLATYFWSPMDGLDDPSAQSTGCQVTDTTVYVVTVTSGAGCTAVASVVVVPYFQEVPVVPDPCGAAFMPDMFSPNNDGLNDRLCVLGGCYTAVSLMVYDSWGQRVYSSEAIDACWDGELNGTPLPAGLYAVTFSAQRQTGEQVEHQGTITLRR